MNWNGKRVLVTGAGGFIGSHLTEHLVQLGAKVKAMVHYNALGTYGWLDTSPWKSEIEIFAGDICDRDSVRKGVANTEIVFHLAALIAIPYSYYAPVSYIRTNIEGTMNLLQSVRETNCEVFVQMSSSEVYGTAIYVPIDEKHPLQGQSPYSATKIGADKIAEAFHLSFNVPVVTARPFNTFGPRQSARAVIPTIITQCFQSNTIKLGNLQATRDLNYVSNTVEGLVLLASTPNAIGKTVNLGSNREISIEDLAHLIAKLMNKEITIETEVDRLRPENSEVERLIADSSLATELTGWKPKVTLEEGLSKTIEWFASNLNRYNVGIYTI